MAIPTVGSGVDIGRPRTAASFCSPSNLLVTVFCSALVVGYTLSFSERIMFVLTLLPGNVLPPNNWIWTCLTHSFIEIHFWIVLCDMTVAFLCSKLLGPLWGSAEIIKFYVVVTLLVAILSVATYLFLYVVTGLTDFLFDNYIHGSAGYLAGFSVAVKQVMPDHILVTSPFGKLRNKDVPLWILFLAVIFHIVGIVEAPFPLMFSWGLLVSWVYLRYYQKHSNGNRGDTEDNFSFVSFFPNAVQPVIAIFSNCLFSLLVKIKICRRQDARPSGTLNDVSTETKDVENMENDQRLHSANVEQASVVGASAADVKRSNLGGKSSKDVVILSSSVTETEETKIKLIEV